MMVLCKGKSLKKASISDYYIHVKYNGIRDIGNNLKKKILVNLHVKALPMELEYVN